MITGTTTYTATGSHTFACPTGVTIMKYLIVAGGGGGGSVSLSQYQSGGGGGAGGMLEGNINNPVAGNYSCVVGAGGAAESVGKNSGISGTSLTTKAYGGGPGAHGAGNCSIGGGSGGGGGNAHGSPIAGGTGTTGQGSNGGSINAYISTAYSSGGGGKTSAGSSNITAGAGKSSSISGAPVTYAAGGVGRNYTVSIGPGSAGTTNRGNGGSGAATNAGSPYNGGAGGSGIIILALLYTFTLVTSAATNIEYTKVTLAGTVVASAVTVTDRGFCWNTSAGPTTGNTHVHVGSGTGNFTSNATQLIPNTLYYVRTFALTNQGLAYGNEVTFTTHTAPIPTITSAITKLAI